MIMDLETKELPCMKVTLFVTCVVDIFETSVGKATVELLERLGCEIDFPEKQVCCGQPSHAAGYVESSKPLMKDMIETFEHAEIVVTPSGSCALMLKKYPQILEDEPHWAERATALADKTYELTDFIVNVLKIENVGAKLNAVATYHTSCQMTRLLGVKDAPFKLLSNVEGLQVKPLPYRYNCCGFGGTFSTKMAEISEQMVDEKVNSVIETNADILVAGESGCMMNIAGRMERRNVHIKVMHIAEVLNSN